MAKAPPPDFIPVGSLRAGRDPQAILARIRDLYFRASRETIERDLALALELLKSLPDETERERATVYMQGLAEMRRDWAAKRLKSARTRRPAKR